MKKVKKWKLVSFAVIPVIALVVALTGCGETETNSPQQHQESSEMEGLERNRETVKDVVCGMSVELDNVKYEEEYRGETYYFCSSGCQEEFNENPKEHL